MEDIVFIKITNKQIADKLSKAGFPYTTETLGRMKMYCFHSTPEFIDKFQKYEKYAPHLTLQDNKMRF